MLGKYIKKASYNTLIFSTSSIISRFFSFLFLPYFLSKLTLEEFGVWEFYQSFFSIGSLILTSSTASGLTRYYLLYKDNLENQLKIIGNAFITTTLIALAFPIASLFILWKWFPTLYNSEYSIISVCSISFFSLFSIILVYLRVKESLLFYLAIFCTQNFIALFITVLGVQNNLGIRIFFYANLISYILFLPLFIYLLYKNFTFSPKLFNEQLYYTLPLIAYSLIYIFFFNIDRWMITYCNGYELLGKYALLWRFGTIFQFFAIAMFDAWPIVLFNAQKEKNCNILIARLIILYTSILSTGCLFSVIISRAAIDCFFPNKLQHLGIYLPFFFLSILFMEIAKIFQSGLGLATKTTILPILTLCMAGIQITLLIYFQILGLWGIFLTNIITFMLFSFASYIASSKIYSSAIFDNKKLVTTFFLLSCFIATIQILFFLPYSVLWGIMICCFWPFFLWKYVMDRGERKLLITKIKSSIDNYFKEKKPISISNLKTLLFLKTDVYDQEIKGGGSHSQTIGELTAFKKNGYTIICATSTMKEIIKNLNLHYFQSLSVWPVFFFLRWKIGFLRWHADCFFSNFCFTLQTKNLFKKYSIDAIYQCYSWMNCTGLILSKLKNKPLILEFNGSEVWITNYVEQRKTFVHKVAEYIEYLNLQHADFIIVISEALKDKLIQQGFNGKKILVNPNGADTELFNPGYKEEEKSSIRQRLKISEKTYLLGYISTFSFWHGIELITALIPKVIAHHKNIHFLLIGDGMLKKNMETELSKRGFGNYVTFTGMVDLKTARNYLSICDAFLCPTQPHKDGTRSFYSPIKLFEYMSLAKPIIASDLEQQKELLFPSVHFHDIQENKKIEKQCGILLHPQNIDEWISAITYLITLSSKDQQLLGKNAREKILSHYTWNHHIDKIKKFVEK
jgi:glycosyltransferase involved in cell wall biosynthesis